MKRRTNAMAAFMKRQQPRINPATARLNAISEGLLEEVAALNAVIRAGKEVRFPVRESSMASGLKVDRARYGYDGIWVTCVNYGGSYALGNDERWAELLMIAGVERDARTI